MIKLPLMLCSDNLEALERAMRHYNGKPLVRTGLAMECVLPLLKKYGGVLVCDEPEMARAGGLAKENVIAADKLTKLQ
jgi:cobalamin-dependent methionine synthase I